MKKSTKIIIIVVSIIAVAGAAFGYWYVEDQKRQEAQKRREEATKLIMGDQFVGIHDKDTAISFIEKYNFGGAESAITVYRDKIEDTQSNENKQFLVYDLGIMSDHTEDREVEVAFIKIKADVLKDFETLYATSRRLAQLGDEAGARDYLSRIRKIVDNRVYKVVSNDIETTIKERK